MGADDDDADDTVLGVLGLGRIDQAVYETLVELAPATADDLAAALPFGLQRLRTALAELTAGGLVAQDGGAPPRFTAFAPDIAMDRLLSRQEERLKRARRHTRLLADRFRRAANDQQPVDLIEVVHGGEAAGRLYELIMRSAQREIRFVDRPPYLLPIRGVPDFEAELLRRGVRIRVIYDSAGFTAGHELHGDVASGIAMGEDARVLPGTPVKLVLVDGCVGLIPLVSTMDRIDAVAVLRPSPLLDALGALFEALWERAMPLGLSELDERGGPSQEEQQILALLTAGLPDGSASKQLGISIRTYERRVRDLMDRLGVRSRFQAGLQAHRRGWIR